MDRKYRASITGHSPGDRRLSSAQLRGTLIASRMPFRDGKKVPMNDMQMVGSEQPATTEWLRLIKAEYLEIPGLCLTKPQVERFWNIDPVTAESVMGALLDVQFLRRTQRGAYVLDDLA